MHSDRWCSIQMRDVMHLDEGWGKSFGCVCVVNGVIRMSGCESWAHLDVFVWWMVWFECYSDQFWIGSESFKWEVLSFKWFQVYSDEFLWVLLVSFEWCSKWFEWRLIRMRYGRVVGWIFEWGMCHSNKGWSIQLNFWNSFEWSPCS